MSGFNEKLDNVVNLQEDEKLKLQLEIRKMSSDLKKEITASTKKKQTIENLDSHFNSLLKKGSVLKSELDTVKKDVVNQYTEAKISNPSGQDTVEQNNTEVKTVEDDTNRIIEKTNKHGIQETKADAQGAIETIEKEIDASMATIDTKAEAKYDQWFPQVPMTKEQQNIAFSGYAYDVVNEVNSQLLTVEERAKMTYRFELRNLKAAVLQSQNGESGKTGVNNPTGTSSNPEQNTGKSKTEQGDYNRLRDGSENREIPDNTNLFVDFYTNINYAKNDINPKRKIFDVYKDKEIRNALDTILDPNDKLSDGTFGINPSKSDGLAGVIDSLSSLSFNGYQFGIDKETNILTLQQTPEGIFSGPITGKQLKTMKIPYAPHKGQTGIQLDNEWNKLAKIFNTVSWDKLQGFSSVVNARTQSFSSINETANTVLTQGRLTTENVFQFLCDRNGDGVLSANSNHATEQKNQGDIGNIFGQQLFFTIDQAINIQEALHKGQGEQIVIQKILLNAGGLGSNTSPSLMSKINEYSSDPVKCTRENLVKLIQDYPEFKTLFGAAIERMNGGNKVLTPDLYDTLTGNGIRDFLESKDWELINKIEKQIDDALNDKKAKDPIFAKKIANYGIIELRQNLVTQIMNVADGLTIVGSDTQEGYLRNPGISKEFVNKEAKKAFINDLTKETLNAIALGTFFPENGIRIPVTFIKKGKSESGRTLWRVQAGPSIGWNRESNDILFTLGVAGEIAEQYNYNKVINAPLDKVALAAKYIGAEGQITAGAQLKELNLGVEGSAGISREKSPIMGINQINRQYEDISKRIFRLSASDINSYESIYTTLKSNINKLSQAGKYEKFATTNKKMLESDVDFVVSFLKANDILKNIPGNKLSAIEELMDIIQNGNLEQWRSDVLNNLHNKTMLTRLSFGVTTNILTASFKNSDKSHTTPDTNTTGANSGVDMDSFSTDKQYKFGIAGYYIGARWSNFKTTYKVNENQLANTRYEIAEGKNTYTTSRENFTDEQYAKYIEAVFSKKGISVSPENGKIVIRNTNPIKLPKLLSIRVTPDAKKEVKYEETSDTLTIGNVQEIGAYTTALANGVIRQLVIGSKKYKDGTETVSGTEDQNVNAINMRETDNYEAITFDNITSLAKDIKNEQIRTQFLACFDQTTGQLNSILPNEVSLDSKIQDKIIKAGTTISFIKVEGGYSLSLEQANAAEVKLHLIDGESFANGETRKFKTEHYDVQSPKDLEDLLQPIKENLTQIAALEKGVNRKFFRTFMQQSDKDVRAASEALWKILPNNNGPLGSIKTKLQEIRIATNPNDATKDQNSTDWKVAKEKERYLVDQFKGLFAFEAGYPGSTIAEIFSNRKNVFANLLINKDNGKDNSNLYPDWVKEIVKIRGDILNSDVKTKKYSTFTKENVPELFGYTAFYRLNTGDDAREYKLVSTGNTSVLPICGGDEPKYRILTGTTATEAKKWILGQFDVIKEQKALFLNTILSNITDPTDRSDFASELNTENIAKLLTEGQFTLDNGTKRIILNTSPTFYFKGECVNESLGLLINSLEIQKAPISATEIKKERVPDRNVNIKAHHVASNPNPDQNQIGANLHVSQETLKKVGDGSWTEMDTNKDGADGGVDVQ